MKTGGEKLSAQEYIVNNKRIYFVIPTYLLIALILLLNINFDFWSLRRNFESVQYKAEIEKYASQNGIDQELLAAVIYVESRFNPDSESNRGAVGLMQIMPATAQWIAEQLGEGDFSLAKLKDPEINIRFGSWYFAYLYEKFDQDLVKALAAYNAGQTNVARWTAEGWQGEIDRDKIKFKETYHFVKRVISTRDFYKEIEEHKFYLSDI